MNLGTEECQESDAGPKVARCYLLTGGQIEHYWPQIQECLEEAPELWNKYYTVEGLLHSAYAESVQVWVLCDEREKLTCIFFSRVMASEVGRDLLIFWMWGHKAIGAVKCISLAMDRFAAHHECRNITVVGRPGWVRALRALGGQFEAVLVRRPVQNLREN